MNARMVALPLLVLLASCAPPKRSMSARPPPAVPETTQEDATVQPGAWLREGGWIVRYGWTLRQDASVEREGFATWALERLEDTRDIYGTFRRVIDAKPYRGKRVRASVLTKTIDAGRFY